MLLLVLGKLVLELPDPGLGLAVVLLPVPLLLGELLLVLRALPRELVQLLDESLVLEGHLAYASAVILAHRL